MTVRSRLSMALVLVALVASLAPARAAAPCTDATDSIEPTQSILGGLEGHYALPSAPTDTVVVMAHGYRNRSTSWAPHLRSAARDHGAIAVAMDYSGTGPAPDNRGWKVREGAADSIAAAQYFLANCAGIKTVAILGVSMGGNASGLAVAAQAQRPGGAPLFDYWVDVEGATNPTEEYLLAKAAANTGDPYIVGAVEDFEETCGGTLAEQPECYRSLNVVAQSDRVAGAGLKGVVVVHGLADGLVPYNQSRELATVLRAQGVPLDFYSVGRRNDWQNPDTADTEGGTTGDGHVTSNIGGDADRRPLAGHGWEGSTTHIVIKTGFDRLWATLDGVAPAGHEFLVDSETGTTQVL